MMIFDCEFAVNTGARYRKLLLAGTAVGTVMLLPAGAQAQSVWGGVGSTTSTNIYNTGTNWSTNPMAPTAAGSSAQFTNTGLTAVSVVAPIAPDSWTFNANSQSYTMTGSAVSFSNLTNNASAGQAISIANNLNGTFLSQAAASTLTITGTDSITQTSVSAGTLVNNGALTSSAIITAAGTFTNNLTVTGTVSNLGTFNNNSPGTVSALLNNNGGTTTNSGTFNNGVSVNGGTFTQTAGAVNGGLTNFATVNANGGAVNDGISNNAGSFFNIGGTVTSNSTFNNSTATSRLLVNSGSYTVTGLITNSGTNGAGGILVTSGATLTANSGITNTGTITNNGTLSGTGTLSQSAGTTTNSGSLISHAILTGGTLTTTGTLVNGISATNATVNAQGSIFGGISNLGSSVFTVTGALTTPSIFTNSGTAQLSVATGNFTGISLLTNDSTSGQAVQVSVGRTLDATTMINNAGTFTNNGITNANLGITNNNIGTSFVNNGTVTTLIGFTNGTGASLINTGTLNSNLGNSGSAGNSGIVNGFLSNYGTGTYTQTAGATNNGALNSGAIYANGGAFNGGIVNSYGSAGGSFIVGGTVTSDGTFNNDVAASRLIVDVGATYTVAGAITNSGTNAAGGILVAAGATLTGNGGITNNAAATFVNNGTTNTTGGLNNLGIGTNSGAVTGGLTNSGTYTQSAGTTSGGTANTGTISANGGAFDGVIANNAGGIFNIGGTVTSNSTFNNSATSRLLVNTGSYTVTGLVTNSGTNAAGGILVAAGATLTANGGITNNTGATIVNNGTVNDLLTNSGTVTNNLNYNGDVTTNGTIANSAAGTWTGNVIGNAGNATGITNNGIWVGNVQANTGAINNNLTWTGTVSNGGTFHNNAAGTVSGLLTNTAGTTTNDGTLSAGATVNGGTLTGQGFIVGTTTVAGGGTFAPGNGTPGTAMTLTGSLALQSGAFYMVQINPATSSLAKVTGNATLGGATVKANFTAGNYVAKQYLILHTTSGVTGTFNPTVANTNLPSNFQTALSYDPNGKDVHLDLTLSFSPPSGSLNGNQQKVGNAIVGFFNSTGGIPLVFSGLTPAGLTQISGETATGAQQTTFDAMTQFMGIMTDPFIGGRGDGISAGSGATPFAEEIDAANAYAAKDPARSQRERDAYATIYRKAQPMVAPFNPGWSIWAAGFDGSQTTSGNATLGSNDTTSRLGAVAVGADYRFSPNTTAGFALAGGGTSFSVANGGTGRSDLFQAGAFVRHTVGPAYFTAALAYGWQDITTDRTVTIAGIDQLRARFNANAFSGRVEDGYRFVTPWMGGLGITPYAAGQFTTFDLPAYAENAVSGANTFALSFGAKSVTATRSEVGLRTDKSWAMPDSIFTLRGRFALAHDYNTDRSVGATFQTLPGASFVVNGARQLADKALTTASAEVKWRSGVSLAATFEGEFSGNSTSYAGKGVARYQW